jgi:hypothetical protein
MTRFAILLVACSSPASTPDAEVAADARTPDSGRDPDAEPALDAEPSRDAGPPQDSGTLDAPGWVAELTPGRWAAISMNTIADVDPADDPALNSNHPRSPPWNGDSGQSGVLDAWNGGAFVPTLGGAGALVVWGGGHRDYYGNELYAFDVETRRWSRLTDPYAGEIEFPYDDGFYPDGTPVPPHTYDQVEFHPPTNSFLTLRTMAHNNPSNVPVVAMFSFDTMSWRRSPVNDESHHSSGGWSAYDASREVIWAEGGSGTSAFTRFEPDTENGDGTFGRFTNHPWKLSITSSVAALDPTNDILLVPAFRQDEEVYAIDLSAPDEDAVAIRQAGTPPPPAAGSGWEWSHARGAFIYYATGDGVFELALTSGDWRDGEWTWSALTDPGNDVSPDAPGNPVYSRFRLVEFPGVTLAIVVTRVDRAVYAFRFPS